MRLFILLNSSKYLLFNKSDSLMSTPEEEVREALAQSFGLLTPELISEEVILSALAFRLDHLIAGNPDQLFSMLYRLDISEQKIKEAMATDHDVTKKIAVLIYERQLEKIISRKNFNTDPPEEDLAW